MLSPEEQLAVLRRGVVDLIQEEELLLRLHERRPLVVKLGADPSAPDLHLGHVVVLRKLRQFQDLGHRVTFLIGDFTGRIGDPTGRSETRKPLSEEEVRMNAATYQAQVFQVLKAELTDVRFNSEWMMQMSAADLIALCSHYTVARMLERDDFAKRFRERRAIAMHEFLYPLIQGYDSVVLRSDVEVGGTDQKFNLLVGRDLQRAFGQVPQVVMTLPLLEGTDGVQKMSKSLGNAIGISEPPREMFGKIMSLSDQTMLRYYSLLTDIDGDSVQNQIRAGQLHPMEAKKQLATLLVTQFWGHGEAAKARAAFEEQFQQRQIPRDLPEIPYASTATEACSLAHFLLRVGLARSISDAKRLIRQGAVRIDGRRASENWSVAAGSDDESLVVQIGSRRWAKVRGGKIIVEP